MKVTPEMVAACAAEMVEHDWLPRNWEAKKSTCECCGQTLYDADGDGGQSVRHALALFLTAALSTKDGQPKDGQQ